METREKKYNGNGLEERISNNIKLLGFIMTCFMVFYHVGTITEEAGSIGTFDIATNSWINGLFGAMGGLAMSHFFMITGFLLFYNFSMKNYAEKIKRRIYSLFIPYITWQILTWGLFRIQKGTAICGLREFLSSCFLLERWPVNGPMWYVYAVFLLAIISPLYMPLFSKRIIGELTLLFLTVISFTYGHFEEWFGLKSIGILNYGYIPNIMMYLPSYVAGIFCGRFYESKNLRTPMVATLILLGVGFALNGVSQGAAYSSAFQAIPLIGVFSIEIHKAFTGKRVFKLTFLVYALHAIIIAFTREIVSQSFLKLNIPLTVANLCLHCCVLGIDILAACIIYVLVRRLSSKLLFVITGGRA